MGVRIKRTLEEPVNESALDAYANRHGLILPPEYRTFLLQWNVAKPEANEFPIPGFNQEGSVHYFFGVSDNTSRDLAMEQRLSEGRLPEGWMSIATDECGNPICLVVSGNDSGAVYFMDHEREDEYPNNVYKLAASFTEFIEEVLQPEDAA